MPSEGCLYGLKISGPNLDPGACVCERFRRGRRTVVDFNGDYVLYAGLAQEFLLIPELDSIRSCLKGLTSTYRPLCELRYARRTTTLVDIPDYLIERYVIAQDAPSEDAKAREGVRKLFGVVTSKDV